MGGDTSQARDCKLEAALSKECTMERVKLSRCKHRIKSPIARALHLWNRYVFSRCLQPGSYLEGSE
jgi:hypothetical protein